MSADGSVTAVRERRGPGLFALLARLLLGAVFVAMGWAKASDPVAFLKLLREYQMVPAENPWLLNGLAAVLPWFEIVCGTALLLGLWRRGAALLVALMLVGFSYVVWDRARGVAADDDLSFCAVAFDCGCGGGVVNICRKLAENAGLFVLALVTLVVRPRR